jgi:excisionase family DNA binding protein
MGRKKQTVDPTLPTNRLWNVGEVALYLCTTPNEIYKKVSQRTLPGAVKMGGSLRFKPDKIKKWVASCELPTIEELTQEKKGQE